MLKAYLTPILEHALETHGKPSLTQAFASLDTEQETYEAQTPTMSQVSACNQVDIFV